MGTTSITANRRLFLKTSLLGGVAAAGAWRMSSVAPAAEENVARPPSRVALTASNDRAANTLQGLKSFQRLRAEADTLISGADGRSE